MKLQRITNVYSVFRTVKEDKEMTSWVKLHKKLIDKPIWKNSTLEQRVILITLLCSVNDEATEWDYNGEKFIVEAGQLVTSIAEIVEMCDDKKHYYKQSKNCTG